MAGLEYLDIFLWLKEISHFFSFLGILRSLCAVDNKISI